VALPIRLSLVRNAHAPGITARNLAEVAIAVKVKSAKEVSYTQDLPAREEQRRAMQRGLLQGWGLFYDMSYTDQVLMPHGARVRLAVCEASLRFSFVSLLLSVSPLACLATFNPSPKNPTPTPLAGLCGRKVSAGGPH
jgi:hypothetical protein